MRALLVLLVLALIAPQTAAAVITFTQLDDDVFTVSHRVKLIGSRNQATRLAYTKAASLCVAAGFSHYRVLNEASEAAQEDDSANATVRAKFFLESGDDRTGCQQGADPKYVAEARAKLMKRGYTPPSPEPEPAAATDPATEAAPGSPTGSCTLEQIAAMARTGLSDEQIRAACL